MWRAQDFESGESEARLTLSFTNTASCFIFPAFSFFFIVLLLLLHNIIKNLFGFIELLVR